MEMDAVQHEPGAWQWMAALSVLPPLTAIAGTLNPRRDASDFILQDDFRRTTSEIVENNFTTTQARRELVFGRDRQGGLGLEREI